MFLRRCSLPFLAVSLCLAVFASAHAQAETLAPELMTTETTIDHSADGPRLLFRSGFEGDTRVVPAGADDALIGKDDSLPDRSDWVEDMGKAVGFTKIEIEYTGGDPSQRFGRVVPEPGNPDNHVLWFWLNDGWKADMGATKARVQLDLYGREKGFPEFYQSVRVLLPGDWLGLRTLPEKITWLTIAEFWNNVYWVPPNNPTGFRIGVGIGKPTGDTSDLSFLLSAEDPRQKHVWRAPISPVKVPIGTWFTLEYYFKEGDNENGRFFMAVTPDGGQREVVYDVTGWTQNTTDPAPDGITDWNPLKLYTSKEIVDHLRNQGKTLQIYWDDFELWENRQPTDSTPTPVGK